MPTLRISAATILVAIAVGISDADAQRTTTTEPTRTEVLTPLPGSITEAMLSSYVIAPTNLRTVRIEANDRSETMYKIAAAAKSFTTTPHLDVAAFGGALHAALKDNVAGYVFQVRQNGTVIHNGIWQWAQTTADGGNGWSVDTRMHVASVSKFLTSVAMVKVLDAKGISYDTPIAGYLPAYWSKGMNVDDITFRHLFRHQSGFNVDGSASDYLTMKSKVAGGVGGVGMYAYENMNFGLMRILIPIINGDVSSRARFVRDADLNDKAWDATTLFYFLAYMQANVFNPAGVSNVQFKPVGGIPHALAYRANDSGDGWNSGDISPHAGGAAFHLSVKELLNVLDHVRRKNTIIPAAKAQYMLDNLFGLDQQFSTPAGKIYNKNGSWGAGCLTDTNCKIEQSVAYFLPNNMEVAVFVNSPIGPEGFSLRGLVKDAFLASLTQ